jgi:hypothetical protein
MTEGGTHKRQREREAWSRCIHTKDQVEVTEMFNNIWALLVIGFVVLVLLGVVTVHAR